MIKVSLSNGKELTCTKYHKFYTKINLGDKLTYERKIKDA